MLSPVNCLVMVSLHRNRKVTRRASQSGCQEISHNHTSAAADRAAPSHHDRKYPLHQHKPSLPCLASDMYACSNEKSSHWSQPYKHILGRGRRVGKGWNWRQNAERADRRKKTPIPKSNKEQQTWLRSTPRLLSPLHFRSLLTSSFNLGIIFSKLSYKATSPSFLAIFNEHSASESRT